MIEVAQRILAATAAHLEPFMERREVIDLFGEVPRHQQRQPKLVRMHVVETGDDCGYYPAGVPAAVRFACRQCRAVTGWMFVMATTARRGIPCKKCNAGKEVT